MQAVRLRANTSPQNNRSTSNQSSLKIESRLCEIYAKMIKYLYSSKS